MKRKGLLFWLSVFLMLSMIFSLGKYEIQASEGNPVAPVNIDMSIDNLFVGVGSKGFHPSSGNHLAIRTSVSCNTKQYFDGEIQLRLRILNKSGDYVYQKVYSNIGGKNIWGDSITSWKNKTIYLNWNGKASKANTAGVKYGSFVPDGTYRIEVFYYAKDNSNKEYVKTIAKKKSFKVSSKAPSGKDGVAAAATIPEYTGVDEIDYMAEKMITSAGIKTTMGQDEKVRRIYHWMTVNFKHKHADEFVKAKTYYDVTSAGAKKKIQAYKKQTLQNYRKGKLIFRTSFWDSYQIPYMQKRGGVCSDQAEIFAILCRHVGVDAGVCNGYYKNLDGSTPGHSWNYAVVNGRKYYYDVDIEIQNYGKGQGDYYWYKKTLAQAKGNHVFA